MKIFLFVCTVLASTSSFAYDRIELPPGGSMRIGGSEVFCVGQPSNIPVCTIRSAQGSPAIYSGNSFVESFSTLEGAIAMLAKMRTAGACQ